MVSNRPKRSNAKYATAASAPKKKPKTGEFVLVAAETAPEDPKTSAQPTDRERELQTELDALKASQVTKSALKNGKVTISKQYQMEIQKCIAAKLFKTTKFVSTAPQEISFAKEVFKAMYPDAKEATIKDCVDKYSGHTVSALNSVRIYVSSRIKEALDGWMQDHTEYPSVKQLKKCLYREINVNFDDEMELFCWYNYKFLPMVCGGKGRFGENIRRNATISKAHRVGNPQDLEITPQDEAFGVVCYENNLVKWKLHDELKKKYKDGRITACRYRTEDPSKTPILTDVVELKGKQIRIYGPKSWGKFTISNAGSQHYGGWNPEGLKQFNRYFVKNFQIRKTAASRELEEASLVKIKELYAVDEEAQSKEKPRKRKAREVVDTWDVDLNAELSASEDEAEGEENEGEGIENEGEGDDDGSESNENGVGGSDDDDDDDEGNDNGTDGDNNGGDEDDDVEN